MNLIALTTSLPHLMTTYFGADHMVTALVVLLGALGGWYLGNASDQWRSKRVVVELKGLRKRSPRE
ncbi:MAG TPA: hypothetical protein VMG11_05435 [Steroidobacteraceae bacterium]|nr:hypothetical protein [Steroidobacteraceae bacterium]